ncbi:MAG: MoaD/ThiS family protein [Firmicutes bacterium]|jgi:molybdopterin converting factor small subunit|nr:MoaD/ThiS family protein [Bacillota bacterium]
MSAHVKVRLDSLFRELAGRSEIELALPGNGDDTATGAAATVGWAVDQVAVLSGPLERLIGDRTQRRHMKFTVNGKVVPESTKLADGDIVGIYSPFLGG